jgi:aspartate/methionine/tyrosine aminotransferase
MPDIYWENYNLIFKNGYGAEFDSFPFFSGNGFNLKGFEETISKSNGKKIVFFNFPNNPVGYTVSESEAGKITDIIKNRAEKGDKIVVIVDDAYFGLVYEDGIYKESLFSNLADLHENVLAVKVDGPTKESYVWGLRVGFITYGIKNGNQKIYSALEAKSGGIVRGSVSMCSNLSQSLIVDAIKSSDYDEDKREKYDILKKRYEIVKEIFGSHKEYSEYFEPLPFNSGYFMCVKLKNLDAEKVRKILLDNYSTGVIAIENLLRVTFSAIPSDKISKIFDNIYNACKEA